MAEPDRTEADNEVARAIIRRRDRFYVYPSSPFEGYATEFSDGVGHYYIDRRDGYLRTGDHWQKEHEYFRPAAHLMDTIVDLVRDAKLLQGERRQATKAQEIINGYR